MLTHSSHLNEYSRDRVNTLLHEAEQVRLARRCQRVRPSRLSHMLFYTGGWLVRCGDWLQRRFYVPSSIQPNLG
jgi:hypothetical protein